MITLRKTITALFGLFCVVTGQARAEEFLLGVDVFLKGYTNLVKNQTIGLITNQTGCNQAGKPTIDLLYEHPDIRLVALFAPEHGIRGVVVAGEAIKESKDEKTGLPIYSLYGGDDKRPPKVVLDTLDAIVYDIQDVGSRAYTYIWSMAEALAAAGASQKTMIILDRPNPLGCLQVDGPITEEKWRSFIGLYPIPRVYGLTAGELARYLNREYRLQCRLIVIPMANYRRDMDWHDLGLKWIAPSPNIPSAESAICFGATGTIGVLGVVHIGIGTQYPFQMIGAPWLNSIHAAYYLNACNLPGVTFRPFTFTPAKGFFHDQAVNAVRLDVHDPSKFLPATTEVFLLDYLQYYYRNEFSWKQDRFNGFDKAMGTSTVRTALMAGKNGRQISSGWLDGLTQFSEAVRPYLLYK